MSNLNSSLPGVVSTRGQRVAALTNRYIRDLDLVLGEVLFAAGTTGHSRLAAPLAAAHIERVARRLAMLNGEEWPDANGT